MKSIQKIACILLSMIMVLSLATVAFAAEEYTITIENEAEGYVYDAYQIFTGTMCPSFTMTEIEWGSGIDAAKTSELMTALNNLKVGAVTPFAGCKTASDVADVLEYSKTDDNDTLKAFAEALTPYLSNTKVSSTYANKVYSIDVDASGYYLVKNSTIPDVDPETGKPTGSYTRYILRVVKDVTVTHKGNVPSSKKNIVENGELVEENQVSIGDTIEYQFTGTMPSNIDDYDTYYYLFTDTLSRGLTFQEGTVSVTVNGKDVTDYFYISAKENKNTSGTVLSTTLKIGMPDILALELLSDPKVGRITADTTVIVNYEAILNVNAEIGTVGNKNDVDLTFSNDPNDDGDGAMVPPPPPPPNEEIPTPTHPTGITPKSEVFSYTTELTIIKTDPFGNILTGAAFKIEGESLNTVITTGEIFQESPNGTYYKLKDNTYTTVKPVLEDDPSTPDIDEKNSDSYASTTITYEKVARTVYNTNTENVSAEGFVNKDGKLTFTGLGAGTYTITETVTPDGYHSIQPFQVTITWSPDGNNCTWTYAGTDYIDTNSNGQHDEGEVFTNTVTVINRHGTTLPSTGGIGTTIFYILGSLLVLGAVVLLVSKKRMSMSE